VCLNKMLLNISAPLFCFYTLLVNISAMLTCFRAICAIAHYLRCCEHGSILDGSAASGDGGVGGWRVCGRGGGAVCGASDDRAGVAPAGGGRTDRAAEGRGQADPDEAHRRGPGADASGGAAAAGHDAARVGGAGRRQGRAEHDLSCVDEAGLPLQKKSLAARERNRPDVLRRRTNFRLASGLIDPRKLVFIDESGARTHMTRLYGRSVGGSRCVDYTSGGHWKSYTMLAAMRAGGVVRRASLLGEGAMDGAMFLQWVRSCLAPSL